MLLQGLFLDPGGDIRLSTGIETDIVGDTFGRVFRRVDRAGPDHGKGGKKDDKTNGNFFHIFSPFLKWLTVSIFPMRSVLQEPAYNHARC
jgi:hypothetical protein